MTLSGSLNLFETSHEQQIISLAVPRPLYGLFTYKISTEMAPLVKLGCWVRVPFGKGTTHAFVVELPKAATELPPGLEWSQLKSVMEVDVEGYTVADDVLALCRWAHEYYFAPLGEVINCALPNGVSGVKKFKRPPRPTPKKERVPQRHVLTEDQQKVVDELDLVRCSESGGKAALLKGVTGSGKTEVYIELASRALAQGKGVLILVPEIALTPQLFSRFEKGLGVPVALWHSAVAAGKRRDQYVALRKGEIRVVVGARSAVFAPIENLGLIVVDEEHDSTYKQEDRFRYNARDLSIVRSKLTGALVVLGSATPSLETQERVREKKYSVAILDRRIASAGFPQIELVDLCVEELIENTQAILAKKTINAIQETLAVGGQVMVYLNRRGFAAFLLCKECRHVVECPQCSISLTVHKRNAQLRCHVCAHKEPIHDSCVKCKGIDLHAMGAGTESLEDEFPKLIEGARVLRLDRDQVTSAKRLDSILDEFRNEKANILLGTQMLVKGHDFPGVTLVVVILADSLFRWPDFRAPERALQILRQFAGRAGRGDKAGKVLIQSYDLDHTVLQVMDGRLSEADFLGHERDLRQVLNYPPFGRLARLRFESTDRAQAISRAESLLLCLKQQFQNELSSAPSEGAFAPKVLEVLGPSEAFLERAKGIYRWDLLIKTKSFALLQKSLAVSRNFCIAQKWPFFVDVDPTGG